jgi:BirA family biotin operon repressor/biotin-[acetyl-CoA-carboxylase] ligase
MQRDRLDSGVIAAGLDAAAARVVSVSVHKSVESTNDVVRDYATPSADFTGTTVLAEEQTGGRGRRGKAWHSPPGGNLYLSMGWEFELPLEQLSGLSLAIGAMLAEAFAHQFGAELQLKWPNDFYFDGRKLGGILVELLPEQQGRQRLVLGIGLNVAMPLVAHDAIDRPWTDLTTVIKAPVERNALAASVINTIVGGLVEYHRQGLSYWLEPWRARDFLLGRSVTVDNPLPLTGTAAGVNDEGALMIHAATGQCVVAGGEVSIVEFGGLS